MASSVACDWSLWMAIISYLQIGNQTNSMAILYATLVAWQTDAIQIHANMKVFADKIHLSSSAIAVIPDMRALCAIHVSTNLFFFLVKDTQPTFICFISALNPLSCQAFKNVQAVQQRASVNIDVDGSGPLKPFPVTCEFYCKYSPWGIFILELT